MVLEQMAKQTIQTNSWSQLKIDCGYTGRLEHWEHYNGKYNFIIQDLLTEMFFPSNEQQMDREMIL